MAGRRERDAASSRRRMPAVERVAALLLLAWAVGQTARDATLPTALVFYVPSLIVAGALGLAAIVVRLAGGRAMAVLLLAVPPLAVGLVGEHRWWPPAAVGTPGARSLRLVHWNVSGGWAGLDQIAEEIAGERPDVVALSEAPQRVAERVAGALAGREARTLGGLTILAPRIESVEWIERGRELQAIVATLECHERPLRLMVVNLASSPWVPRRPSLERVRDLIRRLQPDLVVGDFNAPRRSRVLAELPSGYRHAYEEAGWGWSATWPMPLPLLSLDHVLVGPRWRSTSYALRGTPWSDHRLQRVELVAAAQ